MFVLGSLRANHLGYFVFTELTHAIQMYTASGGHSQGNHTSERQRINC